MKNSLKILSFLFISYFLSSCLVSRSSLDTCKEKKAKLTKEVVSMEKENKTLTREKEILRGEVFDYLEEIGKSSKWLNKTLDEKEILEKSNESLKDELQRLEEECINIIEGLHEDTLRLHKDYINLQNSFSKLAVRHQILESNFEIKHEDNMALQEELDSLKTKLGASEIDGVKAGAEAKVKADEVENTKAQAQVAAAKKAKADAEKIIAAAEKAKADAEKAIADAGKVKANAEKAKTKDLE